MLKIDKLQDEIKKAFDDTIPGALEQALQLTFPEKTATGDDIAKRFGETVNDLISEALAQRLAAAIDYHVRSADIYGTIVTVGSPITQTATIESPSAVVNGKVPNTLGIK